MQVYIYTRVCKENKKEILEKINDAHWNNFVTKGVSLKGHIGRVGAISWWYSQGWFTIA